jgi:hypothetical protein
MRNGRNFGAILAANRTGEMSYAVDELCRPFLWRANLQSGFASPGSEHNAITNRGFGHSELTFVSALETEFGASHFLDNFRVADNPGIIAVTPIDPGLGSQRWRVSHFPAR